MAALMTDLESEQCRRYRFGLRWSWLLLLPMLVVGCQSPEDFPNDPEKTLQKVRGGKLRAGVIHAPPWVVLADNEPSGLEADLVRRMAKGLDADVEWIRAAPDQLLLLLEEHELDILIGGFDDTSPVTEKVGKTRPYAIVEWWLVSRGQDAVGDITGKEVSVAHGKATALVKEAEATPVFRTGPRSALLQVVPRIGKTDPPPPRGLRVLGRSHHVLIVPPGENAWVVAVDRFLHEMRKASASGAGAEGSAP